MNKRIVRPLTLTLLAPIGLLFANGCSKSDKDKVADAVQQTKVSVVNAAEDVKAAAITTWDRIKDATYEKRSEFSASLAKAADKMDEKIADLKTKAAPDSPERAEAIKKYDEARAELKSKLSDLGNASADTWSNAKEEAAKAWRKLEAAFDKATK
ncbi:MAG: hypothetical protein WAN79_14260 [Opitutaceae bacterium]